jgi:hypothetical protein
MPITALSTTFTAVDLTVDTGGTLCVRRQII